MITQKIATLKDYFDIYKALWMKFSSSNPGEKKSTPHQQKIYPYSSMRNDQWTFYEVESSSLSYIQVIQCLPLFLFSVDLCGKVKKLWFPKRIGGGKNPTQLSTYILPMSPLACDTIPTSGGTVDRWLGSRRQVQEPTLVPEPSPFPWQPVTIKDSSDIYCRNWCLILE